MNLSCHMTLIYGGLAVSLRDSILTDSPVSGPLIFQEPLEGRFSNSCMNWRKPSKMSCMRILAIGIMVAKLEAAKTPLFKV